MNLQFAGICRHLLFFVSTLALTCVWGAPSDAFGVPPLESKAIGKDTEEIRIAYVGSLAIEKSLLVIERKGGNSSASYFPDNARANLTSAIRMRPNIAWTQFWKQPQIIEIFDLLSEKQVPRNPTQPELLPFDDETITVEVKRGGSYKEITWYAPMARKNPDAKKFVRLIEFFQATFMVKFPKIPASQMTGTSRQ